MLSTFLISAIDPSLGRLDYGSLSNQARMEIFVDGLSKSAKKKLQDKNGGFLDYTEWPIFFERSEGGFINLMINGLTGTLNFSFLPENLTRIHAKGKKALKGTLETSQMPRTVAHVSLWGCGFSGTVDFTSLPGEMQDFGLPNNSFTGSCDFTKLPATLITLDVSDNNFYGSVSLDALPSTLEILHIYGNQFSGEFKLISVPQNLQHLYARGNNFEGVAKVAKAFSAVTLGTNYLSAVHDENGSPHSLHKRTIKKQKK